MTTAEAAQLLKAKFVVHDMLDEPALAADFGARSALSRADPYYHFTSATQAYEREQYAAALASLRKAPRLSRTSARSNSVPSRRAAPAARRRS